MTAPQPLGFLSLPPSGTGRGVLVLHPWWGLNDTLKSFCTRLSAAGFVAFAPDLFHGNVAATIPEAENLSNTHDHKQALADIAASVAFLGERSAQADQRLAVVGFSFGAYYALNLSVTHPEHIRSVVIFYGTRPGDYTASRAEYLGHYAEADVFESEADVNSLEQSLRLSGRPVTFHHYPGTGHWFFEPDRTDAYNPAAALLAWNRTLTFLNKPLPSDSN
jgi:carboxymethylenebutenolidase